MIAAADLVLLTVPDDALRGLVSGLAATGAPLAGRLLAHASGRHGLAVLEPAIRLGALPLALHPVMTFTGRPDDVDRLAGISFGVTAPDRAAAGRRGAGDGDGRRAGLHRRGGPRACTTRRWPARPTTWSRWCVQAADLLDRGRASAQPARMLGPLLSAALDNALRLGDAALTGPVARGDADTVAGHLDALRAAAPEALPRLPGAGPADRHQGAGRRHAHRARTRSGCSTCSPRRPR